LYVEFQGLSFVQALFYGISPAVISLISVAAVKLARLTDKTDWRLWAISAVVALSTAVSGAEIALLFVAAGLLMVVLDAPPRWLRRRPRPAVEQRPPPWSLPILASTSFSVWTGTATTETLVALGWFFLKAGAFI